MGLLYDKVKPARASLIGTWPKQGYDYEASAAEVNGRLIGLALDEDNEAGSTAGRVQAWVRQLKKELRL
jgi:flavodoxin I